MLVYMFVVCCEKILCYFGEDLMLDKWQSEFEKICCYGYVVSIFEIDFGVLGISVLVMKGSKLIGVILVMVLVY